jgi:alpha-N-arabinofuranosidase
MWRQAITLSLLIMMLALGSACARPEASAATTARFAWFEYTGADAVFDTALSDDEYRNPILAGYYPDPSVVRVGPDFYMVNSTFGFFPGIPVFRSRDLVNWEQIGNAVDRPDMMPYDGIHLGYHGVYAATIEYQDGTFYIMNTCVGCGGNFVLRASDPAGPWSDPIWLPHIQGIDPSLFFDDDGKVYVVHHGDPEDKRYDEHTAIYIMEVDPETFAARSDDVMLVDGGDDYPWNTDWIEGPHLYKIDDNYLLSAPGGGTGYFHQQLMFRADDPFGPFRPWEDNPSLTQFGLPADRTDPVTATGHADMFQDTAGDWWAVFLGTRVFELSDSNSNPGSFLTGRETFLLPVRWQDGWPVILDKGLPVPYALKRPRLPEDSPPEIPTTGNFTLREEFADPRLGFEWLHIRAPRETWWQTGTGELVIEARSDRVGDPGQPSFVGRRLQHMTATWTTSLEFEPQAPGEEAGLLAIQNDDHYYAFGIYMAENGATSLRVRRRADGSEPARGVTLYEEAIDLPAGGPVLLRMSVDRGDLDFSFSLDGDEFDVVLDDADARVLSTAVAGGFTGAVVGMFAERDRLQVD